MARWGRRVAVQTETVSTEVDQASNSLTAAAVPMRAVRKSVGVTSTSSWQDVNWGFYGSLGEVRFAIDWKAEMVSRVRLRAGRIVSGEDEPQILDEGEAADLVNELGGGIGGQSELLRTIEVHLSMVGESYLVGEVKDGKQNWSIRSNDEIRRKNSRWEVISEESAIEEREIWRPLAQNSLVTRVWMPNKRYHYKADSPMRSIQETMTELELANRRILAQYRSRLTSAGVFLIPDEVSFPVQEKYQDAEDPFVEEWIDTAREAIENPGSASAAIPLPMRVPSEYIEDFRFVDFSLEDDDKIIEKRESAIRRLATQVDVPAEILLGMGDVNHWSAWQLEESAIKAHISSDVETIVHSLTIGYLHPRLRAAGIDPDEFVVWYDTSELTLRPDRSDNAFKLYDRKEINGAALRRENGFNEADRPNDAELEEMVLKDLTKNPQVGFFALDELTDGNASDALPEVTDGSEDSPDDLDSGDDSRTPGERSEPDTRRDPPPTPGADMVIQATSVHRIEVDMDVWQLHHPECCRESTFTCPVAEASRYLAYTPGTSGNYECWLSTSGELVIGKRVHDGNAGYLPGHVRQMTRKALSNGYRSVART